MAEEVNKLIAPALTVLTVAAIVLVAMAITAQYSRVLRTETVSNQSNAEIVTLTLPNASIRVGTSGQFPLLQGLTGCLDNSSRILQAANYSIQEGDTTGGRIILEQDGIGFTDSILNCSGVTYLATSDASNAADKFTAGLGIFGTFIAILALAIIGLFVVRMFKGKAI